MPTAPHDNVSHAQRQLDPVVDWFAGYEGGSQRGYYQSIRKYNCMKPEREEAVKIVHSAIKQGFLGRRWGSARCSDSPTLWGNIAQDLSPLSRKVNAFSGIPGGLLFLITWRRTFGSLKAISRRSRTMKGWVEGMVEYNTGSNIFHFWSSDFAWC